MNLEGKNKSISAAVICQFEGDDKARDKMDELRKLRLPELFVEQSINLDADEREDTVMSFSDRGDNLLFVRLGDEEGEIEITIRINYEHRDVFESLIDSMADMLPEAEFEGLSIDVTFEKIFEDLKLPVGNESNYEIKGMRLSEGETEYAVQELEEDEIQVIGTFELGKLKSLEVEGLIEEKEEKIREFVEGMQ